MYQFALDEIGNRIFIEDAEKGKTYRCSVCQKEMIPKKGSIRVPHFAHKPGVECTDWGDMSEWHSGWQKRFPKECQEVVMEKDGEKHRADVYIEKKKLVIEFQHSPISAEEFNRRNLFYTGCGYQLIWVFDAAGKVRALSDRIFSDGKVFYNKMEWMRKRNTFLGFPEKSARIFVYLEVQDVNETRELLAIYGLDEKRIVAYYTAPRILPENFVKTYGGVAEEGVRSIEEILDNTRWKLDPQGAKREMKIRQLRANQNAQVSAGPRKRPVKRRRRF